MKDLKNFCALPFNSLLTFNNGEIKPCCDIENMWVNYDQIDEAWNNEKWKEIRRTFLEDGRHPNCHICWRREDLNQVNARVIDKEYYDLLDICEKDGSMPIGPSSISIRLGNVCNLKCVMCGPSNSTKWYDEINIFEKYIKDSHIPEHKERDTKWTWQLLDKIEEITFIGGEPFLFGDHKKILEKLIEINRADKVTLHYATNLTVLPDWIFEYWEKFKMIKLRVSLDAMKEQYNYIRFPGDWNDIELNLDKLESSGLKNYKLSICYVFMNINALELEKMYKWRVGKFQKPPKISPDFIEDPSFFSTRHCDNDFKLKIKESLLRIKENYVEHDIERNLLDDMIYRTMEDRDSNSVQKIKTCREYLLELDRSRSVSFLKTFKDYTFLQS